MKAASLLAVLALAISGFGVRAEVINTDAGSSWLEKKAVALAQSVEWLQTFTGLKPLPPRPPRNVKLAIVGLGRTGTLSVSAALKRLGYAPILTTRDKAEWARSYLTIVPVGFIPDWRPFKWIRFFSDVSAFNREETLAVPTNGRPEKCDDIPTLEAGFEAWTEFVRAEVPEDRLLEFDMRKGWEPLCEFLAEDVPDEPFPHLNDRVVVATIVKVFVLITWIWPLLIAAPIVLVYFLVVGRRRGRGRESLERKMR